MKKRHKLQFPILADSNHEVIRRWRIFDNEDPKERAIPYPSTFIVASDGRIAWSYIGRSSRDRPEIDEILERLANIAAMNTNI